MSTPMRGSDIQALAFFSLWFKVPHTNVSLGVHCVWKSQNKIYVTFHGIAHHVRILFGVYKWSVICFSSSFCSCLSIVPCPKRRVLKWVWLLLMPWVSITVHAPPHFPPSLISLWGVMAHMSPAFSSLGSAFRCRWFVTHVAVHHCLISKLGSSTAWIKARHKLHVIRNRSSWLVKKAWKI